MTKAVISGNSVVEKPNQDVQPDERKSSRNRPVEGKYDEPVEPSPEFRREILRHIEWNRQRAK